MFQDNSELHILSDFQKKWPLMSFTSVGLFKHAGKFSVSNGSPHNRPQNNMKSNTNC